MIDGFAGERDASRSTLLDRLCLTQGGPSEGGSVAEGGGNITPERRLVVFDSEQVIAASVADMPLSTRCAKIASPVTMAPRQALWQFQRRRDLVDVGFYRQLADHGAHIHRKGRESMARPAFVAPGAAQRLVVDCHMVCTALPKRMAPQNQK